MMRGGTIWKWPTPGSVFPVHSVSEYSTLFSQRQHPLMTHWDRGWGWGLPWSSAQPRPLEEKLLLSILRKSFPLAYKFDYRSTGNSDAIDTAHRRQGGALRPSCRSITRAAWF